MDNVQSSFSIVIVNFNLTNEVNDCLKSIQKYLNKYSVEVVVVDNNSSDRDIEKLAAIYEEHPKVSFYFLKDNRGFGAGNNFGASKSSGDILFFLNPDAMLIEDPFEKIRKIFLEHEEIAIVGPGIIDKNGESEYSYGNFPGPLEETLELIPSKSIFRKKIRVQPGSFSEVDWITGAALFIRKNVFRKIKGFDEDYFLYNEEADLCKRAMAAGHKTVFLNSGLVCHLGSVSSKKNYYNFTLFSYESRLLFIKKHYCGIKSVYMRAVLLLEYIQQICIWTIMIPLNKQKSVDKIRAFGLLIKRGVL